MKLTDKQRNDSSWGVKCALFFVLLKMCGLWASWSYFLGEQKKEHYISLLYSLKAHINPLPVWETAVLTAVCWGGLLKRGQTWPRLQRRIFLVDSLLYSGNRERKWRKKWAELAVRPQNILFVAVLFSWPSDTLSVLQRRVSVELF